MWRRFENVLSHDGSLQGCVDRRLSGWSAVLSSVCEAIESSVDVSQLILCGVRSERVHAWDNLNLFRATGSFVIVGLCTGEFEFSKTIVYRLFRWSRVFITLIQPSFGLVGVLFH